MDFKRFLQLDENTVENWKKYVSELPELQAAVEILDKLEMLGGKAYIVGGAVRDIVLGTEQPNDIDIATSTPIDKIAKEFKVHDIGQSRDFGIVTLKHKGFDFEVAQFRKDGEYIDGRRPESVEIVMDFRDDAARRDLTINALGIDKEGNILDYFDGVKDIRDKTIRTVGDAHERFGEDFLRMIRVPRFAARFGFKIDPKTLEAIQNSAENIKEVAMERIYQELYKMAKQSGDKFADAIVLLKDSGLLKHILPEVLELTEFEHSVSHHPEGRTVWDHVIAALKTNPVGDPILNLGILLHDVGKAKTHAISDKGLHSYLGHAHESVKIIDDIADRLKMDNKTREALKYSAGNHMKIHEILKMKDSTLAKLMNDPNWDLLMSVAEADGRARGEMFSDDEWNKIIQRIDDLKDKFKGKDALNAVKKIVSGNLIRKVRPDLKPGPIYGDIITATIDWIFNDKIDIDNTKSIEQFIKDYK